MDELTRFARRLVEQLGTSSEGVHRAIPVAALRETVIPYRKHRKALGVESVEDYETLLVRLVAGERGYLRTVPAEAAERCRSELAQASPDLTVLDEVAGATVQITSMIGGVSGVGGVSEDAGDSGVGEDNGVGRARGDLEARGEGEVKGMRTLSFARPLSSAPSAPSAPSVPSGHSVSPVSPAPSASPLSCSRCDHSIPAGRQVVFCPWCGQRLIPFACARCNTELDSEWRHCITCGAEVKDPFRYA